MPDRNHGPRRYVLRLHGVPSLGRREEPLTPDSDRPFRGPRGLVVRWRGIRVIARLAGFGRVMGAPHRPRARPYILYYSHARFGDPNLGIGVGVSESSEGPFADRGELVHNMAIGVPNSIDPASFAPSHPLPVLGEYARDPRDPARRQRALARRRAVPNRRRRVRSGVYRPTERHVLLFGSPGTGCAGADSTYHVTVGRSDPLDGPYVNRDGMSPLHAAGETILHGDDPFAVLGKRGRAGCGRKGLAPYHACERARPWLGATARRVLTLDYLRWCDGCPTVRTRTRNPVAPAPSVASSGGIRLSRLER